MTFIVSFMCRFSYQDDLGNKCLGSPHRTTTNQDADSAEEAKRLVKARFIEIGYMVHECIRCVEIVSLDPFTKN